MSADKSIAFRTSIESETTIDFDVPFGLIVRNSMNVNSKTESSWKDIFDITCNMIHLLKYITTDDCSLVLLVRGSDVSYLLE